MNRWFPSSSSRLPLTAQAPNCAGKDIEHLQEVHFTNCAMATSREDALARLGAGLCEVKNRAQSLKALLAGLVLRYGMPFVRALAQQLARLVQHWRRTAIGAHYQLRTVAPLESLERIVWRLGRKALAALILALNSRALSVAAKQLITISLSSSEGGRFSGQAYSCDVRLLGGLLW